MTSQDGDAADATSAQAGYLPISLSRLPIQAMAGIPIYLRTGNEKRHAPGQSRFTLLSAATVLFDESSRQRLLGHGVRFVYIPISAHDQFRRQTELQIENIARDADMAAAAKWSIVLETTTEIANELLSQRNFAANVPRLKSVSKAVSSLVLNDQAAFGHLFAASHHDFYTATHMVNVGTWMVALAYAMDHKDEQSLCNIFQAGILHDMGKTFVPKEILNKTGQLTDEEWAVLRSHPARGREHLQKAGVTDPVILAVAQQHHERLDGSGYPDKLRGEQFHPITRLAAVIDTFDAMTSLRPFKTRAMPIGDALNVLAEESPGRYDPNAVTAWSDLVKSVHTDIAVREPAAVAKSDRRRFPRSAFHCPVLVRVKEDDCRFEDAITINAITNDVSAAGMSVLMPMQVTPGQQIRLHLQPPRKVRVGKTYTGVCVRCRPYDDGWFEIGVNLGGQSAGSATMKLAG